MSLIVHKYGGTSMGSTERIKNVAKRVAKWHAPIARSDAIRATDTMVSATSTSTSVNPADRRAAQARTPPERTGSGTDYWGTNIDNCPMGQGYWLATIRVDGTDYLAALDIHPGA